MPLLPESYKAVYFHKHDEQATSKLFHEALNRLKQTLQPQPDATSSSPNNEILNNLQWMLRLPTDSRRSLTGAVSTHNMIYLTELLTRYESYLDNPHDETNNQQLRMLLKHKVGTLDTCLYGIGAALSFSLLALAVIGALMFVFYNPAVTFFVALGVLLLLAGVLTAFDKNNSKTISSGLILAGLSCILPILIAAPLITLGLLGTAVAAFVGGVLGLAGTFNCYDNFSLSNGITTIKSHMTSSMPLSFFDENKKLLLKGHPLLRAQAQPVEDAEFGKPALKHLVKTMFDIMEKEHAVGVAAPQLGVSKQVIVFGTAYTKRRNLDVGIPDTVLINPKLTFLSEEKESGYEGCLNSGELMGRVPRSKEVEYSGFDLDGNPVTQRITGFEARVVQHEVDHLKGILFFDRVEADTELTTYANVQQTL
jgi:peptide deformylase